jgi:hypothetical protein
MWNRLQNNRTVRDMCCRKRRRLLFYLESSCQFKKAAMTSPIVIGSYIIGFNYWETLFNIPWVIMSFSTKHREALFFVTHTDPSINRPDSRPIFQGSAVMHLSEHRGTLKCPQRFCVRCWEWHMWMLLWWHELHQSPRKWNLVWSIVGINRNSLYRFRAVAT